MKETRYFYAPDAAVSDELPEDEAMHALRVLRLKSGDEMMLMDGRGTYYRAEVTLAATRICKYRILETLPQQPQWKGHIHLAIAPTKMMDRMEWMVEKAVEIGVDDISFVNCKFSERKTIKTTRLEKIIVAAVKQSHKAWKPVLHDMCSFKNFMARPLEGRRYIAHCYEEVERTNLFGELCRLPEDEDVNILVGPEGDFSIDEVKTATAAGWTSVNLGDSRLRTETAGLMGVTMFQLARMKE